MNHTIISSGVDKKDHCGKEFVPRIAKTKRAARTKYERKKIQKLIKVGRRMERHTANQELKKFIAPT